MTLPKEAVDHVQTQAFVEFVPVSLLGQACLFKALRKPKRHEKPKGCVAWQESNTASLRRMLVCSRKLPARSQNFEALQATEGASASSLPSHCEKR